MRIAVGVSGGGRSLKNLLARQKNLPFEVVLVFSSGEDVAGNQLVRELGIPLAVMNFGAKNREQTKTLLYEAFQHHRVDLVVLAGFLKLLPVDSTWKNKIINIHPALLPKYGGKGMHGIHVHEAVIAAGERESGASVHFVNEKYDEGAVIAQSRVEVLETDSPVMLADRVFRSEMELLPWAITKLATGELPASNVVVLNLKSKDT